MILEKLETSWGIFRDFLWCGRTKGRKIHLVGCDTVCVGNSGMVWALEGYLLLRKLHFGSGFGDLVKGGGWEMGGWHWKVLREAYGTDF